MAFDIDGWKAIGGEGQAFDEGKIFAYTSSADTLATMKVSGYFDSVSNALDAEYFVLAKGTDGVELLSLTRDITGLILTYDTRVQSLSGAGAVDVITRITEVTSTGADALTLADGTEGQRKTITMVVDGGVATLTPTNANGFTTIVFNDVGDTVDLLFISGEWVISNRGGVVSSLQSLTGPGAASLTTLLTEVTTESGDAVTLADGVAGQMKIITLIVDGGDMTLTPANALGYTTIVFADAGDSVTLMFVTGGWAIIGQGGLTTGPLSA